MGLRDLATVLIRLYGLLLLFYCLQTGQQAFIHKTTSALSEPILRFYFISSIASGILYAVMGFCSLIFAKTIAGWVTPKTSDKLNIIVSAADLALVSFSLAGIFFFVDGIRWLVYEAFAWESIVPWNAQMTVSLTTPGIKVVVGLFLLFGSRGLLRVIRWAQRENGNKRESAKNTVELSKIFKCPNCGAEYNPEDYSQDVSEWFCPHCKKALPQE